VGLVASGDATWGGDLVVAGSAGPVSIIAHADIPVVLALDHVKDSVDEGEVRERLGKVAEVVATVRVDLLGVQLEGSRQ
jgi:hypothetical protein